MNTADKRRILETYGAIHVITGLRVTSVRLHRLNTADVGAYMFGGSDTYEHAVRKLYRRLHTRIHSTVGLVEK